MAKAPKRSPRPTPNPRRSDAVTRGNRANSSEQSRQNDVLRNGGRGMKAGGKVKRMAYGGKVMKKAMGGKCRGMGAATKGGNYSRG